MTDSNGKFSSPLYPKKYPTNSNCKTRIESKDGLNIEVNFKFFDIESSNDCLKDFLAIYDGPNTEAKLLGKFCGDNSPGKIISSGNILLMVFHSNEQLTTQGFYGSYRTGSNCKQLYLNFLNINLFCCEIFSCHVNCLVVCNVIYKF